MFAFLAEPPTDCTYIPSSHSLASVAAASINQCQDMHAGSQSIGLAPSAAVTDHIGGVHASYDLSHVHAHTSGPNADSLMTPEAGRGPGEDQDESDGNGDDQEVAPVPSSLTSLVALMNL